MIFDIYRFKTVLLRAIKTDLRLSVAWRDFVAVNS